MACHQTMAIENAVDGAFGRAMNLRIAPGQNFPDLRSSPRGFFTFDAQDFLFQLDRKLIGIPIGSPSTVTETIQPYFLVPIPELITGLPGDAKFPAEFRHFLALQQSPDELQSLVHESTFFPWHTGTSCMPSVYGVLPIG